MWLIFYSSHLICNNWVGTFKMMLEGRLISDSSNEYRRSAYYAASDWLIVTPALKDKTGDSNGIQLLFRGSRTSSIRHRYGRQAIWTKIFILPLTVSTDLTTPNVLRMLVGIGMSLLCRFIHHFGCIALLRSYTSDTEYKHQVHDGLILPFMNKCFNGGLCGLWIWKKIAAWRKTKISGCGVSLVHVSASAWPHQPCPARRGDLLTHTFLLIYANGANTRFERSGAFTMWIIVLWSLAAPLVTA